MSRSPDAELAILLELLSAQEALEEYQRMSAKPVATSRRDDRRRHEADPTSHDAVLVEIEQALIKANRGQL
jgi:hypothetical protein